MAQISIKSTGGWKGGGQFVLGVSMGSQNHQGEALEALVEWINQSSFTGGIIDLSDTLNRYGFMMRGLGAASAMALSRQQGDQWLEQNGSILNGLKKPIRVIRWNEWLYHQDFDETLETVRDIFHKTPEFRGAIYKDIGAYYGRRELRVSADAVTESVNYFLEEIAAHTLLHREYDVVAIYPGKQLESYKFLRSNQVEGMPNGINKSAFVRLVPHSFSNGNFCIQHNAA